MRAGLIVAMLGIGLLPALAEGPRRFGTADRGARVWRTPDTSGVPADIAPRQRRDIQITVDPSSRADRADGELPRRPVRRAPRGPSDR